MPTHDALPNKRGFFSQTDWGQLEILKCSGKPDCIPLLEILSRKYWTPLFQYLRIHGYGDFEAQDLTQDFFAFALASQLFEKADPSKGRFRNFLLKSLNNYIANKRREGLAQKRSPEAGVVSFEDLAEMGYFQPHSLRNRETPESIFHHSWLREVVRNALEQLRREYTNSGKMTHFVLFYSRVISPELNGDEPLSLKEQAAELGLKYKEAANQIVTAKRAFARLLEAEVRVYARSDEEAVNERLDVLHLLGIETRI